MMGLKHTRAQASIVVCALFFIIPVDAFSQPDTLWTRAIPNGSRPMEVILTHDRGFAIGGGAWCGDQDRRDRDFSLIKTDSLGFVEWREFYMLDNDTLFQTDIVYGLEQLSDGGYALVGSGPGRANLMIVRTDSTGEMLWSRGYDFPTWFYDCALADGDDIVVVSATSVARKIDLEDGEIVWQHGYAVEGSGRLYNVTSTADGGFLLTGTISSIGAGSGDMYAVKIDGDGEVEWYNTYGTGYYESVSHAVQTTDGGYCMVGYSNRGRLYNYGMIVRTDSDGEEIWRNIFADEDDNIIMSILLAVVETPDGGFAVAHQGWRNFTRLGRLNSEGELLWSTEYIIPDAQGPKPFSLLLMEDFGYLQGGFASGIGDWLVRTEPDTTNLNVVHLLDPAFTSLFKLASPFPNPFNASVQIQYAVPEAAEIRLAVYDVTGREVVVLFSGRQIAGAHQIYWSSQGVATGTYVLRLESSSEVRTRKLALIK